MTGEQISLPRRLVIALLTFVLVGALLHVLLTKPWEPEGTALTARFDRAGQGLMTSSPVKVRGVRVGRVEVIDLLPDRRVELTLRLHEGVRVPATARASLEPESVFGPKFINLVPGDGEGSGPYLADGSRIRATAESEDLNDLLSGADRMLGAIDARDVSTIIGTLAQGLGGRGEAMAGLIDDTEQLVAIAHRHRERAVRFTADLAALARTPGIGRSVVTLAGDGNALVATAASGTDRVRRLASGTAAVAQTVGGGLSRYGPHLSSGVQSAERAMALVHHQLGVGGKSVRSITAMLPNYLELAWPTADPGKRGMAIKAVTPSDPCVLFIGVCTGGTED